MPVTIYANFESILQPENNEKQNSDEPYTKKYKNMFIILLIAWLKKVNIVVMRWKKLFDKKLVMTKMDEEDFKKSAIC